MPAGYEIYVAFYAWPGLRLDSTQLNVCLRQRHVNALKRLLYGWKFCAVYEDEEKEEDMANCHQIEEKIDASNKKVKCRKKLEPQSAVEWGRRGSSRRTKGQNDDKKDSTTTGHVNHNIEMEEKDIKVAAMKLSRM